MVPLIVSTILSCRDAAGLIDRVSNSVGLNSKQKTELIIEFTKIVPSCPIIIKKDEQPKK